MAVDWDFRGEADEDGGASVVARVCSLDGSGDEVAPGEGPVLLPADVSAVTCRVYDLGDDETTDPGTEVTPAPTIVTADVILPALRTAGWPVESDGHGYNFRHDVGPAYLADPGEYRLFEYKLTLTGGGVLFVKGLLYTRRTAQS